MPDAHRAPLSAALEALLVRELRSTWAHLNYTYFHEAMMPAVIELSDSASILGRWNPTMRSIEISRALIHKQPWFAVVEVLKHEMAHQFVHEVLKQTDETAHGNAFRSTCERMGIDARASGIPEAGKASAEDERITEKIARLLALAESPNQNEAEAAMAAAQRLMLKHNLETKASRTPRHYNFRHLGQPSGRVNEAERRLAMILGKYFFVEVIWVPVYRPELGKRASILEICGSDENLAIAEYVHGFLTHSSEGLWSVHKRKSGITSNGERRTYIAGVMAGFDEKLAAEQQKNKSEGLVWVKDGNLSDFYRRRHPRIANVRSQGTRRTEAFAHGKAAGKSLVLHRGVNAGAASRGLALPAKR